MTVLRWKGGNIVIKSSTYMQELDAKGEAAPPLTSHRMVGGWRCSVTLASRCSNLRTIHDVSRPLPPLHVVLWRDRRSVAAASRGTFGGTHMPRLRAAGLQRHAGAPTPCGCTCFLGP